MGLLFRLLAYLPLPVLHNLGAIAGWLAYFLSPTYRRRLRDNIAQAGCESARGAAVAEAGKTLAELPKIWLRSQSEVVGRVVAVSGWERVESARRSGRGILFLTPHLGCFEITGQYLVSRPDADGKRHPLTALYRPSRQSWLEPFLRQGRGAHFELAPADLGGVRKLLKALRAGEAVVVLPDQAPGAGEGVWAPFFGRPAYTMTLAARLAQSGVAVLLMYAERLAYGAGYRLHFFAPEGEIATPADINREIERLVRRCPEQYLWGYNRYKGQPPAA